MMEHIVQGVLLFGHQGMEKLLWQIQISFQLSSSVIMLSIEFLILNCSKKLLVYLIMVLQM